MDMPRAFAIPACLAALLAAASVRADSVTLSPHDLPAEARPFIEKGTLPLAWATADLNGDGRQDAILVLERQKPRPTDPDIETRQRPLLILARGADGKLAVAKRNEKIILCSTCGGVMGDPFAGIETGSRTFTVQHYGGSAWRWSTAARFNYSRIDKTWQLVSVEEENFHAAEPDKAETKRYKPPRDFGKIDIADFDPEDWKGRGPR